MKLTKIFGVCALVALLSIGFTSCGGFSEKAAEKMTEKFDDGDMDKDDFAKCIDWAEQAYKDYEEEFEKAISDSKNEKKFKNALEDIDDKIDEDWDGIEDVIEMLNDAAYEEDKDMGKSNIKRWEKVKEKHSDKMSKLWEKAEKKFDK